MFNWLMWILIDYIISTGHMHQVVTKLLKNNGHRASIAEGPASINMNKSGMYTTANKENLISKSFFSEMHGSML